MSVRVDPAGQRARFVLSHRREPVGLPVRAGGFDPLTATGVHGGQTVPLEPYGVLLIREDG